MQLDRGLSRMGILRSGCRRFPEVLECRRRFRNWARYTRLYAGLAEFQPPFFAEGRQGFTLEHLEAADLATTWQIFCANSYRVPHGARVVLDLGANVGAFSIYAARVAQVERVIALEPVTATFARLSANLDRNQLTKRVAAYQQGIGGSSEKRTIDLGSASVHACMYPRNDPRFECGKLETIDVITLDRLFERIKLDEVDMCKMDCEGGEVEAILAASDETLRRIAALSLEYHFYNAKTLAADEARLFQRLERAGFRCVGRKEGGLVAHFDRYPRIGAKFGWTAPVCAT